MFNLFWSLPSSLNKRLESDAEKMEEALAGLVRLHELTKARDLAKLEADMAKSLVEVNRADFERLTELRDQLEGLKGGRCDHGNVEFEACHHVQERKSTVSMTWHRDGRQVRATAPELATRYAVRSTALDKATSAASAQLQHISEKKAELRRLRVRIATSESERAFLKQSWDALQLQHTQRTQGGDTAELLEHVDSCRSSKQR